MHAMCADLQLHEIKYHLGLGHMACETFAISLHNAYTHLASQPEYEKYNKDIGAFLAPHFTNIIALNTVARVTLISPLNNLLSDFLAVRGEDFGSVVALWYSKKEDVWNTDIGFYEDIS